MSVPDQGGARTLLVGPLPPPATGLALAFTLVVGAFERLRLPFEVVDLSGSAAGRRIGRVQWRRVLEVLARLLRYAPRLVRARQVYLLVAVSRIGFLRDAVIIWLASLARRRIVLHAHTGGYRVFYDRQSAWIRWLIRRTLARAEVVVVESEFVVEQFSFLQPGRPRILVVHNGLPPGVEPRTREPRALDPAGPVRLLYLSNLIKSKGYFEALEASRLLVKRGVPVQLDFCGAFCATPESTGPEDVERLRERFEREIASHPAGDAVRYRGVVDGEAKLEMLETSHILILPTTYVWEGEPVCIVEAMAFGLPVVATRFRGIPGQVIDGHNGMLVEPGNPAAVADAVTRLYRDPELYARMSRRARQRFDELFTAERHVQQLLSVLLSGPDRDRPPSDPAAREPRDVPASGARP